MFRHGFFEDLDHAFLDRCGLVHGFLYPGAACGSIVMQWFEYVPKLLAGGVAALKKPVGQAEVAEQLAFGVRTRYGIS